MGALLALCVYAMDKLLELVASSACKERIKKKVTRREMRARGSYEMLTTSCDDSRARHACCLNSEAVREREL